jgi:hypothetical protein
MNKPITARVQAATKAGAIREPLLDVGVAGVNGGAATRKIPSPAKNMNKGYGSMPTSK